MDTVDDDFFFCSTEDPSSDELSKKRDLSLSIPNSLNWKCCSDTPLNFGVEILGFQGTDSDRSVLLNMILGHMNAWSTWADVIFEPYDTQNPQERHVRICVCNAPTTHNGGYWSKLGTLILDVHDVTKPTMHLEDFNPSTPEWMFYRKVRHETGHTLGFSHEHQSQGIVSQIDNTKAIAYYQNKSGWNSAKTTKNILTASSQSMLMPDFPPDPNSIMCYDLPGAIMNDGVARLGGLDIDGQDARSAAYYYPKGSGWSEPMPFFALGKQVAVSKSVAGELEIFYLDLDNNPHFCSQIYDTPFEGRLDIGTAKQVIAVRLQNGKSQLFFIDANNKVWTMQSTSKDRLSFNWSSPVDLGITASNIAAGVNEDGRLELFYLGGSNITYHKYQQNGQWAAPVTFGGQAKQLAVASNPDGGLTLFYIGRDDKVYQTSQSQPGSSNSWTDSVAFSAILNVTTKQIACGLNDDGGLSLFYITSDGSLYHAYQTTPGGQWAVEELKHVAATQLAMISNIQSQSLSLFYIGTDNRVYQRNRSTLDSGKKVWSMPEALPLRAIQVQIAVGVDRLAVFYIGYDKELYQNWQVQTPSDWPAQVSSQGWPDLWSGQRRVSNTIGRVPWSPGTLAVCTDPTNKLLHLVYVDEDTVWRLEQTDNDTWSSISRVQNVTACTIAAGYGTGLQLFYSYDNKLYKMAFPQNQRYSVGPTELVPANIDSQSRIAVACASDGLVAFYIDVTDKVYQVDQPTMLAEAEAISACATPNGVELFYTDLSGEISHRSWSAQNKTWSNAEAVMLGDNTIKAFDVAIASRADGKLELFYVGQDWILYHMWQW